ncbi:CopD family protein [Luteibacter sahnii]|uniref:CopD family protein n=1 Tax=Luteibacter sahnii TaxID=3021977 RepID=UPI002A6B7E30|nr:CopD family protein [Luteibacter sp. PPL193]MDY1548093.1 CopD family protein [Luteibacter sp. PPL193]
MAYLIVKSLHIVFVIAWMATVFYLPRILVNVAEAAEDPVVVRDRLHLMGRRLYRFGHSMFGLAFVFGLVLWLYFHIAGGWLHAKIALVVVMLGYYLWSGRLLKRSMAGGALPTAKTLRLLNELPVFVLLAIVYLVVAKPF